jgi:DNA gyrase subunit A
MPIVDVISLQETAQQKYLNYALSVITSRALPDVRDGLKPVHRRILYAMYNNLHLLPEGRYRKSALVVGETIGKFHPHGDVAVYDAMVRMAQDFSMRMPLVDGHGNFGSIDGDSPAAMRYTECKLRPLAVLLIEEIKKQTVQFRPNYDGTLFEPVVLPAQYPNLLVNGSSGIAVGMATNIPPHNLAETIDAAILLSKIPTATTEKLMEVFHGADFPTGGRMLNTRQELLEIYEKGEGAIELRGEYKTEKIDGGKSAIILTSVPFGLTKSDLVEKIADIVRAGKLPQIVDVWDESTDEVRVVLEMKRGASEEAAMVYLFKHTALQTRFHVNMTCLVPTDNPEISRPERVNLKKALRHFLDFRLEILEKRLRFELEQLEKRIHILKGFAIIFNALDEAIKIIRSSKDKQDAAARLMHRFRIDDIQTDAVLETKLYKLSQLEIADIMRELAEKEKRAAEIRALLADEPALWRVVRSELKGIRDKFGNARRTVVAGPDAKLAYSEEAYIVKEDVHVIVTRDGWLKRQRSYTNLDAIRIREGDSIGWVLPSSTRDTVCFFTSLGKAYTIRVDELSQTTGYGDPIQKYFSFADKEQVVGVVSFDKRVLPEPISEKHTSTELFGEVEEESVGPYLVGMTAAAMSVRLTTEAFVEPSTKLGRTFMKVPPGDEALGVLVARGDENVCLASRNGRGLIFPISQISVVKGAARGVIAMKLEAKDRLLGFAFSTSARQGLTVETNRGRQEIVRPTKFDVQNRAGKGKTIIERGTLSRVIQPATVLSFNGSIQSEDED